MIHVVATIEVIPGKREEFLEHFRRLMPLVQKEAGCLLYLPTVDVETSISAQCPTRRNGVIVVEQWESVDVLEDHLMAPHMLEFRAAVKNLTLGTTLQILEPV